MGSINVNVDADVDIRDILRSCDYYDFKEMKEYILKHELRDYYSDKSNLDPIVAIKCLKAAGVDLQKVYLELHGWFKEIPTKESGQ